MSLVCTASEVFATTSLSSYEVKLLVSGGHGMKSPSTYMCSWPQFCVPSEGSCSLWRWRIDAGTSPCARLAGFVMLAWERVRVRYIKLHHQLFEVWHLQGWMSLSACSHHSWRIKRRRLSRLWRWRCSYRINVVYRLAPDILTTPGVCLVVLMPVVNRTRCRGLPAREFQRHAMG